MAKSVLITGVAGGIGYATAQLFASEGWKVIGVDIQSPDNMGIDFYIQADLSSPQEIDSIVAQVTQHFGSLDTLVNNAAMQICKPIVETSVSEWEQIMNVNLRSPFLLAQKTYPLLKQCQGSIVNVSSVHAIATSANIAAYATTKGGLVSLTRALAIEFASDNIRVNTVLPGAVDTSMLDSGLSRGHLSGENLVNMKQQLAEKTVIGKIGTPEEIAQAILFLADSGKSSFMTGQTLVIDGGATARLSTE